MDLCVCDIYHVRSFLVIAENRVLVLGRLPLKVGAAGEGGQVRIQDFCQGGTQLLRPKVPDVVKRSHASQVSYLQLGSWARIRCTPGSLK